jgi:cation transport ATPase
MEKTYILENLDCANCAAKIEAKWNALPQVQKAAITFVTRQLRLTAEDPDGLIAQLQQIGRTVEAELTILPEKEEHDHHCHACNCGHDHHDHHEHHAHRELPQILASVGLFAAGLLLQALCPGCWFHIPVFILAYGLVGWEILFRAAAISAAQMLQPSVWNMIRFDSPFSFRRFMVFFVDLA